MSRAISPTRIRGYLVPQSTVKRVGSVKRMSVSRRSMRRETLKWRAPGTKSGRFLLYDYRN
jgi:hypothetical protein